MPNLFKRRLIQRLIELNLEAGRPGFDDTNEKLHEKFDKMDDASLLTFFELTVVQTHADGIQ